MQHFIYPESNYLHHDAVGSFAVEYDDEHEEFKFKIVGDGGQVVTHLSVERAAMIAGFLLSKHPAIVKGDAMAFSLATRACDAIHEPDFTVVPASQDRLATTKEQDTTINVTSPDPLNARRAEKAFADAVSQMWFSKDDEEEPVVGELHPDQERRLTALREASIIFGSDLSHDRIVGVADWILSGNAPTN